MWTRSVRFPIFILEREGRREIQQRRSQNRLRCWQKGVARAGRAFRPPTSGQVWRGKLHHNNNKKLCAHLRRRATIRTRLGILSDNLFFSVSSVADPDPGPSSNLFIIISISLSLSRSFIGTNSSSPTMMRFELLEDLDGHVKNRWWRRRQCYLPPLLPQTSQCVIVCQTSEQAIFGGRPLEFVDGHSQWPVWAGISIK